MSRYDTFWPGSCPPMTPLPSPTPEQMLAKIVVKELTYDSITGASPAYKEIQFADGTVIGLVTHPDQTISI